MKTSTMAAIVAGVLLFGASVAGLAGYLWSQSASGIETPPPRGLPAVWPTKHGEQPRKVPMPNGEMVSALPRNTAGNVLCQSLSPQRWEQVLGGKTLLEAQDDTCHLATETLDVSVRLDKAMPETQPEITKPVVIDGHQGKLEYGTPRINAVLAVPLVDVPKKANDDLRTVLRVEIGLDPNRPGTQELDKQATDIAEGVVAATMTPGQQLPSEAKDGTIPAKKVDPVPGFGIMDSAYPMISWQLCTRLSQELGASESTAAPKFKGECTLRGVRAVYAQEVSPRTYPATIGGHQAAINGNTVVVKLSEKPEQTLTLTTDGKTVKEADLPGLAERMLPAMLGK